MSGELVWFARQGDALVATDEPSRAEIEKLDEAECQCFSVVGVRDEASFKRYWVLCTVIAKNVPHIEIDRVRVNDRWEPVHMRISAPEDASDAIKLGVGLYTQMPVGSTAYAVRKVRSISYPKLPPAKWAKYVKLVAPFVITKILPDVQDPHAKNEILQLTNKWMREVEREGAEAAESVA
jgi:hypothetical protein